MKNSETLRVPACNVMNPECPARQLLAILAEKWALLVIHALSEGTTRTGVLRRRIGGISEKMLIQTLKRLESIGVVAREEFAEVPPRVEYTLTELGWSLSPIVRALDQWVESNTDRTPLMDAWRETEQQAIDPTQPGSVQSRTESAS